MKGCDKDLKGLYKDLRGVYMELEGSLQNLLESLKNLSTGSDSVHLINAGFYISIDFDRYIFGSGSPWIVI